MNKPTNETTNTTSFPSPLFFSFSTFKGILMPYDPLLVQPMRDELTRLGVKETLTPAELDAALAEPGTTLVVVNSVCGCAAGSARPAVAMALNHSTLPDRTITVFAGQDVEAVQHLRATHLSQVPPSSPSMALFKDGEAIAVIHRHHIEGRMAETIADALTSLFDEFCTDAVAA
jgi:putative YphP/YqiW family bacilliredoxin